MLERYCAEVLSRSRLFLWRSSGHKFRANVEKTKEVENRAHTATAWWHEKFFFKN